MIIVWFLWSFFLRVSVFAYALKKKKIESKYQTVKPVCLKKIKRKNFTPQYSRGCLRQG